MLARAEALSEAHRYSEAIEAFTDARSAGRGRRRSSSAPSPARPGPSSRAVTSILRSSSCSRRGTLPKARSSPTSTGRTCSFASGSADTSCRASERRSRYSTRRLRSPSGPACRAICFGPTSSAGARDVTGSSDYVAAHEDVERALELAQDLGDRRAIANTYFQASLIAQRQGHWVLSRSYAQRAKDLYQELNDERNVGRLLLALGGLTLLLGDEDQAVEHLKASFSRALGSDSPPDAAQALQGLARVHLNRGEYDQADELARKGARPPGRSGGLPPRGLPVTARTWASVDGARAPR